MAKRSPLNNRINKEDMFKKIMPSVSSRQKTPEKSDQSQLSGDNLLDSFGDDLIEASTDTFHDDLLDQLTSQSRVYATPAAPTAPVPLPKALAHPSEVLPAFPEEMEPGAQPAAPQSVAPDEAAGEPEPFPQPPQGYPMMPPPGQQGFTPGTLPDMYQGFSPPGMPQGFTPGMPFSPGQPPMGMPWNPGQMPYSPMQGVPTQGYQSVPQQPYGYPGTPMIYGSMPQGGDGQTQGESRGTATVVADSASVVTDTVIIQENSYKEPYPQQENRPAPLPRPVQEAQDPQEPQELEHVFQEELELPDTPLLDDYEAFPPLTEENGDVFNIMERIVTAWLDEVISNVRGCTCEKCRLDVAAYALNRLTPQYVVAEEFSDEFVSRRKRVAEAVSMLYQAAFQVKEFPRH